MTYCVAEEPKQERKYDVEALTALYGSSVEEVAVHLVEESQIHAFYHGLQRIHPIYKKSLPDDFGWISALIASSYNQNATERIIPAEEVEKVLREIALCLFSGANSRHPQAQSIISDIRRFREALYKK